MATRPILTINGMYNYDDSIFDNMTVPTNVVKQDVINNILFECAELETYIPDPDVMKIAIGVWSAKESSVWSALQATKEYVYNPIWNKDGTYSETETRNLTGTGSNTTNSNVAAYNATTLQPASQEVGSGTTTDTGTITTTRTEQGNIGVTTTQQMIKEEREIQEFNMIGYITESFKHRFCLMVY